MRTRLLLRVFAVVGLGLAPACHEALGSPAATEDPAPVPSAPVARPEAATTVSDAASPATTVDAASSSYVRDPADQTLSFEPGTVVSQVPTSAADEAAFRALAALSSSAAKLDTAGLATAYPTTFLAQLSYDPSQAAMLDTIQSSALALSAGESEALRQHGFVVSTRREFPTFLRGLAEIYSEHLPVYVTADALLDTVHRSYDQILASVEYSVLLPELKALLAGMRSRLPAATASDQVRADVDLYLTIALSLLEGKLVPPVAGAQAPDVARIVGLATMASGVETVRLFGVDRTDDFSEFAPRAHYADSTELAQYFRAQMWLGRVELRMLETQDDGTQLFRRDQYLATLLMNELVGADRPHFDNIEDTLRTLIGASDSMTIPEVARLVADLGGDAAVDASDAQVIAAIVAGGYGKQQIASHLMTGSDKPDAPLPLDRSFALFGQRYIVDSHVFSEVVYDRVAGRLMPSPLDAAFAALANNQAASIDPDVSTVVGLPGALARMRVLIDAHDPSFWQADQYDLWLTALRTLSPRPDLSEAAVSGLPEVARTEAWGRRMLNTQLGSWSELRHDTLLYAKSSYSGIPGCAFPDAYVDPYPEFYRALVKYAQAGAQLVDRIATLQPSQPVPLTDYFPHLAQVAGILADMADQELRGEPFTDAQLAFINQAVRVEEQDELCTIIDVPDGWYAQLFVDPQDSLEFDPTIADVHTQPADESGRPVGKVLHVGTGYPRFMVATVDTCMGPRAYAGVVFAYHEQITGDFQRIDDSQWAQRFAGSSADRPLDVPWLSNVLAQ